MSKPWWMKDRGQLELQIGLLVIEALVSFGIALITLFVIPMFVGWDAMVDERMAWFMVSWLAGAFAVIFGLFLRAHWKSLR